MYLIYDYQNAILHFSYCNKNESSESRGIYFSIPCDNYYYKKGFFYFSLEMKLKNHLKISDVRFYIKNRGINNFINYFFTIINMTIILWNYFIKKYMEISKNVKNFLKYVLFSSFIILTVFRFFIVGFYEKKDLVDKKIIFSFIEWKNLIHQMPLSRQIELNQHSYFESKVPNIKGISDFQVLSLGKNLENSVIEDRYLAISFKKIISLKNNDSVQSIEPYVTCIGKNSMKYSIFNISWKDRILIFKKEFSYSKKLINHFIFVPKSHIWGFINKYNLKNACDYIVLN